MSTSNGHLSPEYNTVPTRYGDAVLLDDSRYEKELQLQGVEFMGKVALEKGSPFNKEVQIIECGVLSDMKWPGPVSAKKLVETGKTNESVINEAVRRINEFYVLVNRAAKTRCIDGRHDPNLDEQHLGPQVPGGAPGAALAFRLGVDKDDLTRGTFFDDAEKMIATFARLGFAPGGHRDAKSEDKDDAVGCGAIDGMDAILSTMTDPKFVDDHKRVVKQLLGGLFDRDTYLRIMGAGVVVNGRSKEYFWGRDRIIDLLEERDKDSVSVLEGDHQEALFVVNMVPDTTFSSNRFYKEFGIQAFGYDLWRSVQMAGKILPRPDQAVDRERFFMARVMSTVATLMALTDASQRLLIRMPNKKT